MVVVATCTSRATMGTAGWITNFFGLAVLVHFTCADLCSKTYLEPYLQVYPEPEALGPDSWYDQTTDGRTPLYFALISSFGGQYLSSGTIPGVQVALDQINANPSILPDYELRYTLIESVCERTTAIETIFKQITSQPTKIAVIGSGCSVATEPTAEISYFYNLNQLSCASSSPELSNRERFKYYHQLLASDQNIAYGWYSIVRRYGWKRVTILVQDENLFTLTVNLFRELLFNNSVIEKENIIVSSFKTADGLRSLGEKIFDPDSRIVVIAMYSVFAKRIICEAAEMGLKYPRYAFLTYGWYAPGWWDPDKDSSFNCSASRQEIMETVTHTLSPFIIEFFEDSLNPEPLDTGIYGREFQPLYEDYLNNSDLNDLCTNSLITDVYSQPCYDATWTLAFALDKYSRESTGLQSNLANFTYNHIAATYVLETLFEYLNQTDFTGVTGPVRFSSDGMRDVNKMIIYQYRNNDGELKNDMVGEVMMKGGNTNFLYLDNETDNTVWPDGIPFDGIPMNITVTVSLALTIVYDILAATGIVFALVCLIFNFMYRNTKLIRLTSPNLNYVVAVGAIVLYIDVILYVVPSTNSSMVSFMCNTTLWLTAIGYSLCFGPILAKMARVYYIFNNPTPKKKKVKDWMLLSSVIVFVLVDIIILTTYTAVEGGRGRLGPTVVLNSENSQITIGKVGAVKMFHTLVCISQARNITAGTLCGYKAILQVIGLIFAFSTRKVKVKGLGDSKCVGAAIYVTSLVLAVTIVSLYTLTTHTNTYGAVLGGGLVIGATFILALSFIPKMVALYKDPEGENVFETTVHVENSTSTNTSIVEEVDTLKKTIERQQNELQEKAIRIAYLENSRYLTNNSRKVV